MSPWIKVNSARVKYRPCWSFWLPSTGFSPLCKTVMAKNFGRSDTAARTADRRSEEHTSELQSQSNLVCRLLLEKKKKNNTKAEDAILPEHPCSTTSSR